MKGTVYKSTGSWYVVKTETGKQFDCRIKGRFRIQGIKSTNPIVVGDVVEFELEQDGDKTTGMINRLHDRKNYIIRKSVKLSKRTHIIAANLDQVFLLITLKNPLTLSPFIDRFLATAEAYGVDTILLFHKMDMYDALELQDINALMNVYVKIGYTCIAVSAFNGQGIDEVKQQMHGKVSMFSGHSGVGKSTLINTLEPKLGLRTATISEQHGQGQHTTTFAEMFDLSFNARIIDTPGIKGFGMVAMEKEEIGDYFREFFALKEQCKFHNCLHIDEPECAVKKALKEGKIALSRYKNYVQIVYHEEDDYRTDNYKI